MEQILLVNACPIIMLIVLIINSLRHHFQTKDDKYFREVMYATLITLVLDTMTLLVNEKSFAFSVQLNQISNVLYFSMSSVTAFLWLRYSFSRLRLKQIESKKFRILMQIPMYLIVLVCLTNPLTNFIFKVSEDNVYSRNNVGILVQAFVSYIYLVAPTIVAIVKFIKSPKENQSEHLLLSAFIALPLIASLIQLFNYGVNIMWTAATLSELIIYINTGTQKLSQDGLTGILNKKSFELEAGYFLRRSKTNNTLIIIDLDNFKIINDTYGHKQGDMMLREVANLLRSTYPKESLIGRIGGDEFAVLVKNCEGKEQCINKTRIFLDRVHDILSGVTIDIFSCSVGIALNDANIAYSELYQKADTALYISKSDGKNKYTVYSNDEIMKNKAKATIVVVDDVEINRVILSSSFENKYNILEASNGQEALDLISRYYKDIKVLLLDLHMPIMDGYEVINNMKKYSKYKHIKTIIISAADDEDEKIRSLGIDDIIYKPFDPVIVFGKVNEYIK